MSMELQGQARAQYSFKILVNNVQKSSKKRNKVAEYTVTNNYNLYRWRDSIIYR